jgi:hypothetical protein
MIRFLVVEPSHPGSNSRFGMGVAYLRLIILSVVGDVPVNSEALLVTDFMILKTKPIESFEGAHRVWACVRVFIGGTHMCMSICVCTVFPKKTFCKTYT